MRLDTATMEMTRPLNSMRLFLGIFNQVVWCRHSNMSRTYTVNDEPYRLCLKCGVRRHYDYENRHRTYNDLRKLAEWLIPQNEQGEHCTIEPFDGTWYIVQRQGQSRKEIGVTINALHCHNDKVGADAYQWRCLSDMLEKLDHLGVHEGVFRSRGSGN